MHATARLAVLACVLAAPLARAATPACEAAFASAPFPDQATITEWNRFMADLGPRPTASPSHQRFVKWLKQRVRAIPGLRTRADRFGIRRQLEKSATLAVASDGGVPIELPTSGPVPYAKLTSGRGIEGPVVYLPPETAIPDADVTGMIVVRDHVAMGVPYVGVSLVATYLHDPGATLDPDALYERDYLGYEGVLTDLRDATAGGAAGLVLVHEFPREQVLGQYEPYEGVPWEIPAVMLGVDEGQTLKDAVAGGGSVRATMTVRGSRRSARTQNLVATLAGGGGERIVVESHTDGMNAIWDNGPVAMLALATHLASVPVECRPRTFEFVFASAHLHLARHGAERYAESLDAECDTVAFAVALEHLGAREYVAVPRAGGLPGRTLESTGFPEFTGYFASPSPALDAAVVAALQNYDLIRSALIHFSPGIVSGEGGAFHNHGIPTVALIAGPWTLYNPAFGMEAVDFEVFHRQALAMRDLLLALHETPRDVIAGGTPCVPHD